MKAGFATQPDRIRSFSHGINSQLQMQSGGVFSSCMEIAYPLKREACKPSPAGWVISVGTWNTGTCFWPSTQCIQHTPWLTLLQDTLFVFPPHTDTMGNTLDLRSRVQTFLLPNFKTAIKCDLYSQPLRNLRVVTAPAPPPLALSWVSSDQQLPTLAHDAPLVRSRTFPNKTHLIYGFLSWIWVERILGPTCSNCKGENWDQAKNPLARITNPAWFSSIPWSTPCITYNLRWGIVEGTPNLNIRIYRFKK